MNEKPTTFEMLGPVDTGPERKWVHWAWPRAKHRFCGEPASGKSVTMATGLMCPDCERVWQRIKRERGL